jgi:hypothetical protein
MNPLVRSTSGDIRTHRQTSETFIEAIYGLLRWLRWSRGSGIGLTKKVLVYDLGFCTVA